MNEPVGVNRHLKRRMEGIRTLSLKGLTKNTLRHNGCAAITQLVEWLAVNQHVTGSSPVGGASELLGP